MPSKKIRRAAVYARTASRQPADRGAIERQLRACRQAASERGLTLVQEFADDGASGLTLERDALRRLLAHVADNQVDYIICVDDNRLTRDYEHSKWITQHLAAHQVQVVLADADASYDVVSGSQNDRDATPECAPCYQHRARVFPSSRGFWLLPTPGTRLPQAYRPRPRSD